MYSIFPLSNIYEKEVNKTYRSNTELFYYVWCKVVFQRRHNIETQRRNNVEPSRCFNVIVWRCFSFSLATKRKRNFNISIHRCNNVVNNKCVHWEMYTMLFIYKNVYYGCGTDEYQHQSSESIFVKSFKSILLLWSHFHSVQNSFNIYPILAMQVAFYKVTFEFCREFIRLLSQSSA